MKLLLVIAKLSVYSVLTYLVMLVFSVLSFPKSENNQLQLVEENPKHPKLLKTPIVKPNVTIVDPNVTVSNNVNLSCLKENASLIVVVKSKIDNFERRQNIRWIYLFLFISRVFVLYSEIFECGKILYLYALYSVP